MTAQAGENIIIEGEKLEMYTPPLDTYFFLAGIQLPEGACTSLWRGYQGDWEINSGRLYLLKISGYSLQKFFPNYPDRVFAHWYTGRLHIPRGECLHYEHLGFLSVYAEDLFITIEKGVVTGSEVVKNDPTISHAPSLSDIARTLT